MVRDERRADAGSLFLPCRIGLASSSGIKNITGNLIFYDAHSFSTLSASLRELSYFAVLSLTNASSAATLDLIAEPLNALGGSTFAASPITSAKSLPTRCIPPPP